MLGILSALAIAIACLLVILAYIVCTRRATRLQRRIRRWLRETRTAAGEVIAQYQQQEPAQISDEV
jgi:uncharacterized membrane protein YccC